VPRLSAHLTAAALLAACLACGGGPEDGDGAYPLRENPLLVAELSGMDPEISLPRSLALRGHGVAHARLSPTGFPADTMELAREIVADAMGENYLCLLVDVTPPEGAVSGQGRSNISLLTHDSGVTVRPAEISTEVDPREWVSWQGRQAIVASLMDKYQPDVVVMRLSPGSAARAGRLMQTWEGRGLDLVIYSPPRPEDEYRGWAVLRGPSFLGGRIDGLTVRGLQSTLRAVLGAEDTLRAAEGTAAYGHLAGRTD